MTGQKKQLREVIELREERLNNELTRKPEDWLNNHGDGVSMGMEEYTGEKNHARSVNNYLEIFKNSPEGCYILNRDGIIVDVNDMGSSLLAAERIALMGKPFSMFFKNESLYEDLKSMVGISLNEGKWQQMESEVYRMDKTFFYGSLKNKFIKNEKSNIIYLLITLNDITKRKEQEQKMELAYFRERELHAMKSRFITMAAHEFRTPLASILSSAELIGKYKSETDDENRIRHLDKIKLSVQKLTEILNDFLSTNKIENGEIGNNPEVFDLAELIEKLVDEIKINSRGREINFLRGNKGLLVNLDMNLLKSCLAKLIENAIKYSPYNSEIEIKLDFSKAERIIISIQDRGIGIPEGDKKNIFTQFFKGENAENIEGSGLSLYKVKKLISIMGGQIDFDSKENIGTKFKLEFQLN